MLQKKSKDLKIHLRLAFNMKILSITLPWIWDTVFN